MGWCNLLLDDLATNELRGTVYNFMDVLYTMMRPDKLAVVPEHSAGRAQEQIGPLRHIKMLGHGHKCMLCRTGSYHLSRLHHSRYKPQTRCPAPMSFDKTANAAVLGSPGHMHGTSISNWCLISVRRPGNWRPRLRLW